MEFVKSAFRTPYLLFPNIDDSKLMNLYSGIYGP
jgi:hypothetical protein